MRYRATRELAIEHGSIMLMLLVMKAVAARLKNDGKVETAHLRKILGFLRIFADKCHHGKEEGILFPELFRISANRRVVNQLLGEHQAGRDYIRGIADSVSQYKPGSPEAYHIAVNSEEYVRLLVKHIKKENQVLFPLADRQLPARIQSKMEKSFIRAQRRLMGSGKHEKYIGWLNDLKNIYLLTH